MQTVIGTDFLEVVTAALERMAFVLTGPSRVAAPDALPACRFAAWLPIATPQGDCGLLVAASDGLVAEVAGGMLGEDVAGVDVNRHGGATVAEIGNVLGGELVVAMGGQQLPLRLGLPVELTPAEAAARLAGLTASPTGFAAVLQGDTGQLLVAFHTVG
jgi:hypothetical protein